MGGTSNGHAKGGKARFDHVYNQPDPRPYFQTLEQFDYEIPAHGQAMFRLLLDTIRQERGGGDVTVLDLCCSYGVNSALLNHELTLDDLYERYRSPELRGLSSQELAAADAAYFAERRCPSPAQAVGIDTADQAVRYAVRAGLLTGGSSENLEIADPSDALAGHLEGADLITVTGGIGYISQKTFARVIDRTKRAPWVASFALRWVSYEPIAAVLKTYGLKTEKMESRTFPQRRFADDEERDYVLAELVRMGIDPTAKEAEGRYHADFYLSRPVLQARSTSLEELTAAVV